MPSLDDLVARLRLDSSQFDRGLKGVDVSMGRLNKTAASTSSVVNGLTGRLAALGAGAVAVDFFRDSVAAASHMNETMSKSTVVFGESQKAVAAFARTAANSIGQSEQQALNAAATFGNMFVGLNIGQAEAADMSINLTRLASDFASFHDANPQDVIESLGAAFRGEFDSVQRFVPTITAATVEQKALALGLARTTSELDAQDKLVATYRILLEEAGSAAGDFDRTSDGLANQQRTLAANFEDAKAALGESLLPTITGVVSYLNTTAIPAFGNFASLFGDSLDDAVGNFKKGLETIKAHLLDNDSRFSLSEKATKKLADRFAEIDAGVAATVKKRADEATATQAAATAAVNLGNATARTAKQDEAAWKAAEKLTDQREQLAKAHRRVEDALFDLADAEDDVREAEFREGIGSEAAEKARRAAGRARLRLEDAHADVAREVREVADANKQAAEAIAVGLADVSNSVKDLAKAIPQAIAAVAPPATFGADVPAIGAGGLAPSTGIAGLAPGALGTGALSGGVTINVNTVGDAAAIATAINREVDWLIRGGGVA